MKVTYCFLGLLLMSNAISLSLRAETIRSADSNASLLIRSGVPLGQYVLAPVSGKIESIALCPMIPSDLEGFTYVPTTSFKLWFMGTLEGQLNYDDVWFAEPMHWNENGLREGNCTFDETGAGEKELAHLIIVEDYQMHLVKGQVFAFVLSVEGENAGIMMGGVLGSPYEGGTAIGLGTEITTLEGIDFAFEIIVAPDEVEQ